MNFLIFTFLVIFSNAQYISDQPCDEKPVVEDFDPNRVKINEIFKHFTQFLKLSLMDYGFNLESMKTTLKNHMIVDICHFIMMAINLMPQCVKRDLGVISVFTVITFSLNQIKILPNFTMLMISLVS